MAREREHKYLIQINSTLVTILTLIFFVFLIFLFYWFVVDFIKLDIETIKVFLLNKYGYHIFNFILYGLRYVAFCVVILVFYEIIRALIYGKKNSGLVFRIEKGDIYCRCINQIYKKRVLLSLIVPFVLLGIVPIICGLLFKNIYLFFIGIINIISNVRDFIIFFMLLSLKVRVMKYKDGNNKNEVVLELRKDFTNYKNIFIKKVTKLDEYESDSSLFVISECSVLIIVLFLIFILIGVYV